MEWLVGKLMSSAAGAILGVFGDKIVQPFLNVWLKSKDVDLEKFKTSQMQTEELAGAVLAANIQFAQIKSQYALAVLQWWPFRVILWLLLFVCAARFGAIVFDSTWWWIFGCTIGGRHVFGDVCSWSIPAIKGTYGQAELEFLLFFVVAKPVDSAVSGAVGLLSKYLAKK